MDPLGQIKQLYFNATRTTIERDVRRAIELLRAMPTEEDRDRAAVYMTGLADMRKEWAHPLKPGRGRSAKPRTT